jgi:release factor glutamine methyltransferase
MNPLNPPNASISISWKDLLTQGPLPALEVRTLLEKASGRSRTWILANDNSSVPVSVLQTYMGLQERRLRGEPLAYITEEREFYGLSFSISPAVLIPRADTEVLVDYAVQHLAPRAKVLELGTGSGCIAVATAKNRPDSQWVATDISSDAIAIAKQNATNHGIGEQIKFLVSDWFSALDANAQFDAIVSNPPYIAAQDHHLTEGDLPFEPTRALTDFGDGLQAIRAIVSGAKKHLRTQGLLIIEHGFDQGEAVRDIIGSSEFVAIKTHQDLEHRDRFTCATQI